MSDRVSEILQQITEKYTRSAALAAKQDIIPYQSGGPLWTGSPYGGDSWWTGGFWPGLMWQLFAISGKDLFRAEALRVEKRLVKELAYFERLYHDVGFMYMLSCGAHWMYGGNRDAKRNLLHAANLLAGRFNLAGGFIRAWNDDKPGWAIIDSMMNMGLLYWASRTTADPRFAQIARRHTETTLREFIRGDGSCHHIVIFDPATGAVQSKPAGQGYTEGSSWSRGQAWALYGFTQSYLNAGDETYLQTACKVADYFIGNIRTDGLTDCDFRQPKEVDRIDNIAAACAACGLIELSRLPGVANAAQYLSAATRMLLAMDALCADYTQKSAGVLQKCTAAYHDDGAGVHTNIVYGDYFYVEALAKLAGKDMKLWFCDREG